MTDIVHETPFEFLKPHEFAIKIDNSIPFDADLFADFVARLDGYAGLRRVKLKIVTVENGSIWMKLGVIGTLGSALATGGLFASDVYTKMTAIENPNAVARSISNLCVYGDIKNVVIHAPNTSALIYGREQAIEYLALNREKTRIYSLPRYDDEIDSFATDIRKIAHQQQTSGTVFRINGEYVFKENGRSAYIPIIDNRGDAIGFEEGATYSVTATIHIEKNQTEYIELFEAIKL